MVSKQNNWWPPLTTLYINLTERCNLRCLHCWIKPEFYHAGFLRTERKVDELEVTEVEQIIKQSLKLGLKVVKLTGGEPFLRKDIHRVIILIKKYKLFLHIETNGTFIEKDEISFLKKNVDRISISLESNNPETHDFLRGKNNSFERTWNAIELLAEAKINTEVIMSLFQKNITDFTQFYKEMKKMGIKFIKLNTIIPTGRGAILHEKKLVPDLFTLLSFNNYIENKYIRNSLPRIHFSLPPIFKSVNALIYDGNNNCQILNILGILSNGDISICGIGRLEKSLILGNVRKDKIADVWFNNPFLKLIREKLPSELKGICNKCVFRNVCIGFCRANAYSITNDIFAPYYLCEEAEKRGIINTSRIM